MWQQMRLKIDDAKALLMFAVLAAAVALTTVLMFMQAR